MKIAPPTKDFGSKRAPLLPLVPEDGAEMNSTNSVSYSLRVNPADADSPTYKKYVRVLTGNESVRAVLSWVTDTAMVKTGLNITSNANEYTLMQNLLKGSAKTLYFDEVDGKAAVAREAAAAAEPDATAKAGIKAQPLIDFLSERIMREGRCAVVKGIVPNKIVAMVKRYLRRECRKPPEMKVRAYYQHLLRINNDELPALPPFDAAQNLTEDEMIDILCYATPRSWMREMDRQGFDPVNKKLGQVVDFMERIEQAEESDGHRIDGSQKQESSSKKQKTKSKGKTGTKHCIIHGQCSHTSDECEVLKKQASNYKKDKPSGSGGKYGNKTWTRKSDDSTNKSKKELATFIKKAVASGVKKELHSVDKKRKAKDDEFDLNAFDEDLAGFNYSEMDNLKIESDDESEGEVSC